MIIIITWHPKAISHLKHFQISIQDMYEDTLFVVIDSKSILHHSFGAVTTDGHCCKAFKKKPEGEITVLEKASFKAELLLKCNIQVSFDFHHMLFHCAHLHIQNANYLVAMKIIRCLSHNGGVYRAQTHRVHCVKSVSERDSWSLGVCCPPVSPKTAGALPSTRGIHRRTTNPLTRHLSNSECFNENTKFSPRSIKIYLYCSLITHAYKTHASFET